jgi:hypothetical protein
MRHVAVLLAGFGLFLAQPITGATARQVRWEELSALVLGKTVSIVLPAGAVVQGKTTAVTADYLELAVSKTSNPSVAPKGGMRVLRGDLHTLQLQTKGTKFRIISTALGSVGGFAAGVGAALAIDGLFARTSPGAAAALVSATVAGTALGYVIGNAADSKAIILEVVPQ